VALIVAIFATFLCAGWIGAGQAARGERVLGFLNPVVAWICAWGKASSEWPLLNKELVGRAVTIMATAIALLALFAGRRRALPFVLLAAAIALATWGQVLMLADQVTPAIWLYVGGILCAAAFGVACPLTRIAGFPPFPPPRPGAPVATGLSWQREYVLVFGLTVVALLSRLYAVTELPHGFDSEMIESMIASRTLVGFRRYVATAFFANSTGIIHLLPKATLFNLFGTSVYSLRLGSVLFGIWAVPVIYFLVRRLAGVGPALVSTVLLIAAPEQLFWSRSENTNFIPIALCGLISAYLALRMVERFSFTAVLATALWTGVTRFFYQPGWIMFIFPALVCLHAAFFVPGAWRKLWYALPLIAAGVALFWISTSVLYMWANDWHWRYWPAFGMQDLTRKGEFASADPWQLVRLQVSGIATNLVTVMREWTYRGGFSHWYERFDVGSPGHVTTVTVGFTVLSAIGMGYLFGQLQEPRAFALLVWVGLGLLPGVLSPEPADRRISLVFPALYVIAGVFCGAVVRLMRERAGRAMGWVATLTVGAVVAVLAWNNAASHYRLPIGKVYQDGPIRFTQPIFDESDTVLHNLDPNLTMMLLFGNLDRFIAPGAAIGLQSVDPKGWLSAVLRPHVSFTGPYYEETMPPERVEALRAAQHPRHISFLLSEAAYTRALTEMLMELFPTAVVRRYQGPEGIFKLIDIRIDATALEPLHMPTLEVRSDAGDPAPLRKKLLGGVTLKTSPPTAAEGQSGPAIAVHGGFLIEHEGRYRFELEPACADATFTVDEQAAGAPVPAGAGIHTFAITLPSATACPLPLHVLMFGSGKPEPVILPSELYVSDEMAALPLVRARPTLDYPGYGESRFFAPGIGHIADVGLDADEHVSVLVRDHSEVRVQRFDPTGREEARFAVPAVEGHNIGALGIEPGGGYVIMGDELLQFYDRSGSRTGAWKSPWTWLNDIVFWRPDCILKAMEYRDSVAVMNRDGTARHEWKEFEGGPGKFEAPMALAVNSRGETVVIQSDGQALVFADPGTDEWRPVFVRSFRIEFTELPPRPRGFTFDGPDRIVIPDQTTTTPLVYTITGEHLIATDPARSLSNRGFSEVSRIVASRDHLYVLDGAGRLFVLDR